jgi:gluconolactonase
MAELETITEDLMFPEGPIAMADGSVILVEIARGTLSRVHPDGRIDVVAELGGGPNGAAIGPDGKCYVCNNGGLAWELNPDTRFRRPTGQAEDYVSGRIERVDLDTGAVETLYDSCDGVPLRGPNDIVFDRAGGFWFTDLGKARHRDMDRGGVFYAKADGTMIKEAIFPIMTPNGIGLSPDERTVYVAETEGGRLWEFSVAGTGELEKLPFPSPNGGRLVTSDAGFQKFDSLAVEANGNICVATLINGGITVANPNGGTAEFIPMPDAYCTNICFGGEGLETAYITLSGYGKLVKMQWPRPGLPLNFLNI